MAIDQCTRCGKPGDPIEEPLYMGKIEPLIKAHVCVPCWAEWANQRVIIINELRLNLGEADGRKQLKDQMWTFLSLPQQDE